MTTLDGKGQQRHDSTSNWAAEDPVLLIGEVGWADDVRQAKLGNGQDAWTALSFAWDAAGTAAALADTAQTNAETTAQDALDAHNGAATNVHGVTNMGLLLDTGAIGVTVADVSHNHTTKIRREFSVSGTLATGAGVLEVPITSSETLTKVTLRLGTTSTGADVIFDVLVNGLTVFSPLTNRPTVTAGSKLGTTTTFNTASLVDGDYLTVDIVQVGLATTEGENAVLVIESTETI